MRIPFIGTQRTPQRDGAAESEDGSSPPRITQTSTCDTCGQRFT